MSFQDTYRPIPAIEAPEIDRVTFVGQVYQHVALALAAFVAFETIFFVTGIAGFLEDFFFGGGGARWLLMLGGVMVMQSFASNAATDLQNPSRQYVGLFGSAFAQALIFAPYLSYAFSREGGEGTVLQAAVVTAVLFAALTAIGMFTRKDLSFLRPIVMWGFGLAMVAILGATILNFNLGLWFSLAMVGVAGASILFQTQNIVRRYPIGSHVAASIAVFSSLMTMFWYVLRIFMSRD